MVVLTWLFKAQIRSIKTVAFDSGHKIKIVDIKKKL